MNIDILYASTSGNVEAVCEKVEEVLIQRGFKVNLHRAEKTEIESIKNSEFLILATSTWEHGELNPFFKNLYDAMKEVDLKGKKGVFIGLGDRRYEPVLFAEGMELLKRRFLGSGGVEVANPLKIDGDPYLILESDVLNWAQNLSI